MPSSTTASTGNKGKKVLFLTDELFRQSLLSLIDAFASFDGRGQVRDSAFHGSDVEVGPALVGKRLEHFVRAFDDAELFVPLHHSLVRKATVSVRITHRVVFVKSQLRRRPARGEGRRKEEFRQRIVMYLLEIESASTKLCRKSKIRKMFSFSWTATGIEQSKSYGRCDELSQFGLLILNNATSARFLNFFQS